MSLRHAILGVLHDRSMHGYQVASELERWIAGGRYNSAQIYQGLHWLAERGFVTESPLEPGLSRDRRPFAVTASGRREFARWLRAPVMLPRQTRDETLVKLVFLGLYAPDRLPAFLERLRRQHLRRVATAGGNRARRAAASPREALLAQLTEDALRFRAEAELRWIEHCQLRLAEEMSGNAVEAETLRRARELPS